MTTTPITYAQLARRIGPWSPAGLADGAPNGSYATSLDDRPGGRTELILSGYPLQDVILDQTGGKIPYSVERVQVRVWFSIANSASNYDDVSILLLNRRGNPIASVPLYLESAGDGLASDGTIVFAKHTGYGGGTLTWDDLTDLAIGVRVIRSGAASADTFGVDAVGVTVAYTPEKPRYSAPAATPPATTVSLRAYDRAGARLGQVPWMSLSRTIVRNALGSLTSTAPRSLLTDALLGEEVYLRVAEDGVESPDWYLLQDDGDDDADAGGSARPVDLGGVGIRACLDWAVVYPMDYRPGASLINAKMTYEFGQVTPGQIMLDLIAAAQARGVIPHITVSFTADNDSAGRTWPTLYSRVYDVGTTVGKVLDTMVDDAWIDYEFAGFRLDLYAPDDTLAVDFPDSVLRLGQGVTQAPRKRSRAATRTTVLSAGAEGATIEVSDADATARIGRREVYEGRSGVTDIGTLSAATQVSLARQTDASESVTLAIEPATAPPVPRPGGYIRYDQRRLSPTELEPMRVQSIAWDYGDDPKLSIELNDLWTDRDVQLARRVDAILNGSSANERVPQPPVGDDIPPSNVNGLSLVSSPYTDPGTGQQYAQMTATWLEVTTDVDGTPVGELLGYEIEWSQPTISDASYNFETRVVTLQSWSPVVPGVPIQVRIRAFDRWHNYSPSWSPWVQITTGADKTPPPKPTTPAVDNYLGLLRSYWDGTFVGGSARPADFAILEVHVSTLSGFTPTPATLVGTMYAPGYVFTDTPYGQAQFVRFVAVDVAGNRSDPSNQASGATGAVVSADIFDGAVGTEKLANLAVKSAKIDLLAVNTAQVGSLDVGKLTAGTLSAQVTMSGRIGTALTGARVEINSLGIYAWDGGGNQTVGIDTSGNATIVGRYRTGLSGRRIEMGASGNDGVLQFWNPIGVTQWIKSLTRTDLPNSPEELQFRGGDQSLIEAFSDNSLYHWGWYVPTIYRDSVAWFIGNSNLVDNRRQVVAFDNQGQIAFTPLSGGGIRVNSAADNETSPRLQLISNSGYGGVIRSNRGGDGYVRTQFRDVNDQGWAYTQGASFDVMSDVTLKEDVHRVTEEEADVLVDQLLNAPLTRYRYSGMVSREHVGLLAHEAPAQVVSGVDGEMSIDLYQLVALVLLLGQRHDARLRTLEEGRTA